MFYRRKLPHWLPDLSEQLFLFVTWRLAGSIPRSLPAVPDRSQTAGSAFLCMDRATDQAVCGPLWLKDDRVARMVRDSLRYGDHERHFYALRAWVIMPNHVHVLFQPKVPLPVITRWLKGSTARQANLILGRTGNAFWQDESFDRWVRNEQELEGIVRYIEHNPVSAGLVERPGDWKWSSAGLAGESACPT